MEEPPLSFVVGDKHKRMHVDDAVHRRLRMRGAEGQQLLGSQAALGTQMLPARVAFLFSTSKPFSPW